MPEIPPEAVMAAAIAIERELMSGKDYSMAQDSDEALARAALEAAAPILAEAVAQKITEHTVEYANRTAGDDYHLWNTKPWTEKFYPLADRIKAGRRDYGNVYSRRVIVVEDWEEVIEP